MNKEMSAEIPMVVCDESGQTGEDLFVEDQPCFVLATLCLSNEESSRILESLPPTQATERKAKNLLKYNKGREGLTNIFNDQAINESTCKMYCIDKAFMATATLVDIFHYEVSRKMGWDMHRDQSAPALAHLLHITTPVFVGRDRYYTLLKKFVALRRRRNKQLTEEFYQDFYDFYDLLKNVNPDAAELWTPVHIGENLIEELIPEDTGLGYDPIITALLPCINAWGNQFKKRFILRCDQSSSLAPSVVIINALSSPNEETKKVGYGDRIVSYPFLVEKMEFTDSSKNQSVQLADLLAGATRAFIEAKMGYKNIYPEFQNLALIFSAKSLVTGGLLPNEKAIIPENTGILMQGINTIDYTAEILRRQKKTE